MGLLGLAGSLLGMIPKVGSPSGAKKGKSGGSKGKSSKKSSKKKSSTKKKQKKSSKKKKKKKRKKKKKKWGKFFTKARKLYNKVSKSKIAKQFKKVVKSAVLAGKKTYKQVVNKTKAVYNQTKQVVKEVKAAAKEAVKVYKSLDKMEPLKISKDMSKKEKFLRTGFNMGLQQAQKSKGKFDATVDVAKNTYNDVKKLVTDPIGVVKETTESLKNFASDPLLAVKTIAGSIEDSIEKDVIHGNNYSRAYWGTKVTLNTATAVVGTKGVGSLRIIGKNSKGVDVQRINSNIEESKLARESSNFGEYLKKEKEILDKIDKRPSKAEQFDFKSWEEMPVSGQIRIAPNGQRLMSVRELKTFKSEMSANNIKVLLIKKVIFYQATLRQVLTLS
nr:zincin-like metallopeptidase toxin domain-containing protein [Lysinibacillus sphaericus]